jgi:hypothetical protein
MNIVNINIKMTTRMASTSSNIDDVNSSNDAKLPVTIDSYFLVEELSVHEIEDDA